MVLTFLGYRHKFSDSLSAVVTVQDPLNSYRFRQTIDSAALKQRTEGRGSIQAAFFGLSWSYGAFTKRPPTFDFGQSPGS